MQRPAALLDQPRRRRLSTIPNLRRAMALSARPQSLYRHSRRRAGRDRRRDAAAARRRLGHAAGDAEDTARLWPGCRTRTGRKRARSCRSSATGPTSGSRSRYRPATSRSARDPAVILIDQLKQIYIDGELELVETASVVSQTGPQGLRRRARPWRERGRRSRPAILPELRLRFAAAMTPAIAIATLKKCSTSSRWKPIRKSAKRSCNR